MELIQFNLENVIEELDWKIEKNSITSNFVKYFIACELLIEILDGLAYLHGRERPIYHKNLKLSNVLITESFIVKISDFKYEDLDEGGLETDIDCMLKIINELFNLNTNM
jgi:serine/threonine protein kinase